MAPRKPAVPDMIRGWGGVATSLIAIGTVILLLRDCASTQAREYIGGICKEEMRPLACMITDMYYLQLEQTDSLAFRRAMRRKAMDSLRQAKLDLIGR